jgi:hypothetical protein
MLSIEKSKELLNRDGLNYTDEEVKKIREFIYILAEIDYQLFKRKQDERLSQFQSENNNQVKQINPTVAEKQNTKESTEENNKIENENKPESNNLKSTTNETQSHSIHPREYRRAS